MGDCIVTRIKTKNKRETRKNNNDNAQYYNIKKRVKKSKRKRVKKE